MSHSLTQSDIQNISTMGPCWWSYAGHSLAPYCPDEPPPLTPGGGREEQLWFDSSKGPNQEKLERQTSEETARGNKVGEEITISPRLGEWHGPLVLRHLPSPPWRAHYITASQLSGRPSAGRRGGGPPARNVVQQRPHAASAIEHLEHGGNAKQPAPAV